MMDPGVSPQAHRSRLALFGDVLHRFGQAKIRVTGSSMLPAVWPGDELVVRRRSVSEARTGEIAVFTREDRLFAHRVIAHDGGRLVTRGDAVPSPDPPVSDGELLGVVVSVSRDGMPVQPPAAHRSVSARLAAALVCRSPRASAILQRLRAWIIRAGVGRSDFKLKSPRPAV